MNINRKCIAKISIRESVRRSVRFMLKRIKLQHIPFLHRGNVLNLHKGVIGEAFFNNAPHRWRQIMSMVVMALPMASVRRKTTHRQKIQFGWWRETLPATHPNSESSWPIVSILQMRHEKARALNWRKMKKVEIRFPWITFSHSIVEIALFLHRCGCWWGRARVVPRLNWSECNEIELKTKAFYYEDVEDEE